MNGQNANLLDVVNVSVSYRKVPAVIGASFAVHHGEVYGLAGESGSGKTTVARTIMRLINPDSGEMRLEGQRISGKIAPDVKKRLPFGVQMIFQDPMSSLNERAKIEYILAEGLLSTHSREELRPKMAALLQRCGLNPGSLDRFPHEFSGGQRQRISVARALMMDPKLILADEPVSALDVSLRASIINLMMEIRQERGIGYLFISHDLPLMRYACDRIAVMRSGRIIEEASAGELFDNPLHPYTKSLLHSQLHFGEGSVNFGENDFASRLDKPFYHAVLPGHFLLASHEEEAAWLKAKRV